MQEFEGDWNPDDYQGRSREQVEGGMAVGVWAGLLFMFILVAIIASVIGQKLFLWLAPFLQKL